MYNIIHKNLYLIKIFIDNHKESVHNEFVAG